ncbi:zf-HC2 domain-containing protein [Dielma fastidiosa]|uniref:zf-HC2 domain-containing protein n=1 Tax=Dielma fastidiosa TaxID=1034346 RepID=UPI000EDB24F0|nr:zf-HC2 domain-containing protein [Dielma fastidiosa]HAH95146.1 hypothetical protein [Dielma fastidiosa]
MKYPCSLIKDLLPLYHDGVCSEESNKIIENHLSECSSCKDYYNFLCETDEIFTAPQNAELEMKKAASFRSIKRKLRKKQILVVVLAFAIFAAASFSIVGFLKKSEQVISYENNISVSMADNSLIGRLQGNQANYFKIKQVEVKNNGQMDTYLFFYMSGTKWDDLITNDDIFSEYVLCSADKGAENIDRVFYYIGDYTGIESMDIGNLQKIIDNSILLWRK